MSQVETAVQVGSATNQQVRVSPIIYDGTLTQRQADFMVEDRIKVAQMLDDFGMDYIEAGWPTVNPSDRVFFVRAKDEFDPECFGKLVAMAPLPAGGDAKGPAAVAEALLKTGAVNVGVAVNVAASTANRPEDLEATLKLLREGKNGDGKVVVQLHNAMHAYRDDAARVVSFVSMACKSGADFVVFVDNGGTSTPWEVQTLVGEMQGGVEWGKTQLGVDCREGAELSVAATIYAAKQGAGRNLETPAIHLNFLSLQKADNQRESVPRVDLQSRHSTARPKVGEEAKGVVE